MELPWFRLWQLCLRLCSARAFACMHLSVHFKTHSKIGWMLFPPRFTHSDDVLIRSLKKIKDTETGLSAPQLASRFNCCILVEFVLRCFLMSLRMLPIKRQTACQESKPVNAWIFWVSECSIQYLSLQERDVWLLSHMAAPWLVPYWLENSKSILQDHFWRKGEVLEWFTVLTFSCRMIPALLPQEIPVCWKRKDLLKAEMSFCGLSVFLPK